MKHAISSRPAENNVSAAELAIFCLPQRKLQTHKIYLNICVYRYTYRWPAKQAEIDKKM